MVTMRPMADPSPVRVDDLLKDARAKVEHADAEWLLAFVLGKSRSWLYARGDDPVADDAAQRYAALLARRIAGEPLAYLTGRKGFWRFELAGHARHAGSAPGNRTAGRTRARASPARTTPCASPTSAPAAARSRWRWPTNGRARRSSPPTPAPPRSRSRSANARALRLANVEFRHGDWCEPLAGERFDLIASNPPYIALGDPHLDGDLRYEPASALSSGHDGLDAIRDDRARCARAPGTRRLAAHRTRLRPGRGGARVVRRRRVASTSTRAWTGAPRTRDLGHQAGRTVAGLDFAASSRNVPIAAEARHAARSIPRSSPYDTGTLQVDARHTLYYEQCGNPDGKPVVLLHGGPGGGCSDKMRRFHDPAKYRIVLFDQRGSGRSTPHADLVDNTTWHLVADIEKLREKLGIERWQVFGGSLGLDAGAGLRARRIRSASPNWCCAASSCCAAGSWSGSTRKARRACSPMRGSTTSRAIPPVERHDLISAFHRRLTSDDEATRLAAARAWSVWEGATSFLHIDQDFVSGHEDAAVRARVRAHREPLLRQRRLLRGRGPAAARRASHRRHPRRDRARPLRRGLPDARTRGTCTGLAGVRSW